MGTGIKRNGRADSMAVGLSIGTIASVGLTIIGTTMLAKLIDTGKLEWENIGYGIMLQTMTAAFLGARVAVIRIKRQRMMVCALSGLLYFGILLLIAMLFFGGQYEGVGVTALIILAGCGCAALLGMREKRGVERWRKKKSYR